MWWSKWFSSDEDRPRWLSYHEATLLPRGFIAATGKLAAMMLTAHIAIFALGQAALAPFGLAHLAGAMNPVIGPEGFHIPSFVYLRLLIATVFCGSLAAGLAYFDLNNARLAVNLAGGLTAAIATLEILVNLNSPTLLLLAIELVMVQTILTMRWTQELSARRAY